MPPASSALSTVLPDALATRSLGALLGAALHPGDVLALVGALGAGKTTLVQGLAESVDVPADVAVQSPTFTVCNEYPARVPLLHVDLYRLGDLSEAEDIGLVDRLRDGEGLSVVEWADRLPALLPQTTLWIHLAHHGAERRVVVAERDGGSLDWLAESPPEGSDGWHEWSGARPWEASSSD